MDFEQRGVILRLGEVRSFIRKPYIHSSASKVNNGLKWADFTYSFFELYTS